MASMEQKSKVLVIGALGYIGKYIAIASVKLGHPTLVLLPSFRSADPVENEIIESFEKQGVTLFKGDIYNHSRLVKAIHAVDVVISADGGDQTRTIAAIKERFILVGVPIDVDMTHAALQPAEMKLQRWREIRRFVEQSGVPYTFVVNHILAGRFFGRSNSQQFRLSLPLKIPLCGTGNTKVAVSVEKDVGMYTILAAHDSRTWNKTLYIRPPGNVISLDELVSLWESKTGRSVSSHKRNYLSERDLLQRYQEAQPEKKNELALLHSAFIRGDQTNFQIDLSVGVEASQLYPRVNYTTMNEYLNRFL
ncbi:isoflavone reductase [Carex littledalei]|uniref:Isoflavone reductase n=1 Tax=Carex littledalei TaxID=544730 RepID=A0A833VBR0_9POAL|nr:isoflavone reductase [Carex littledalei]